MTMNNQSKDFYSPSILENNAMASPMYNGDFISQIANNYYHNELLYQKKVAKATDTDKQKNSNVANFNKKYNTPTYLINDKTQAYYFLSEYKENSNCHKPKLDTESIRKDFPILNKKVNGMNLIWLDNGATTQKPIKVINALDRYYKEYNSNVHRGAHTLAAKATDAYESAREKVQKFIGASSTQEIVFVRGTTEAINLVAHTYGKKNIGHGDKILLTTMEHHSNIVPWQSLAKEKGADLKTIPINDKGEIILEEYEKLLSSKTKLVAITHVSNILGTINPIKIMIEMAHNVGATVLIDGAQAAPHMKVNVQELNADFYAFSGHKAYGPTGIGVLYGKKEILEKMPPWQKGGGMIKNVNFNQTTYNKLPDKFEAGTGNIADAVGLGEAIDYMNSIGMDNIFYHEKELTHYSVEKLSMIPHLKLVGTASEKISVLSFIIDNISPDIVAHHLNQHGIATRSGHHCAQPTLDRYGLTSTNRASLGLYNTQEDIDKFANVLFDMVRSNV